MSSTIKFRIQQLLPGGEKWTSDAVFEGEYRAAVQNVIAGFLGGQPRAAIEEGTGRVVYALDAKGQATAAAVALFNTIELADDMAKSSARKAKP